MKKRASLVFSVGLGLIALPAASPCWAQSTVESRLPASSASVLVEPQLNDGRLVLRIAVKNLGRAPIAFGPSSISIAKPSGEAIAIYPLASLINDVRMAAGMAPATATTAPTQGAYAAPQQNVRDGGRVDVTGFTGGQAVGGDEYIRRSKSSSKTRPSIGKAEAEAQITALRQAVLQDQMLQANQIAAGQVVSEQLKFRKGEERTIQLRIRVGGDEHGFTIAAPAK